MFKTGLLLRTRTDFLYRIIQIPCREMMVTPVFFCYDVGNIMIVGGAKEDFTDE